MRPYNHQWHPSQTLNPPIQCLKLHWVLLALFILFRKRLRILALLRPRRSPLGPNIKVHWPNQLKLWIIRNSLFSLLAKFVPVDEGRQQHLDLSQRKVEANATPRPRSERHVAVFGPICNFEAVGIRPDSGVVVDCVQCANDDGTSGEFVAAGNNAVDSGCSAGLERRVVETLGFLVEFVEECKAVG
jgi:hypothetical protein